MPAGLLLINVVCCAIWYHFYNLQNLKLQPATLLKLTLLHRCFSRFLSCRNGTKTRNAPQAVFMYKDQSILQVLLVCLKRNHSQIFKDSSCKKFFLQCLLLVQLASTNVFYSMWYLEDNLSYKSLLVFCVFVFFQPPCYYFLWNKCFERNPCFTLSSQ